MITNLRICFGWNFLKHWYGGWGTLGKGGGYIVFCLQEGVVKLDHSGDVKMLQLKYLCKMKSDD